MPENVRELGETGVPREIRAEVQKDKSSTLFFWHRSGAGLQVMNTVTVTVVRPDGSAMPTPLVDVAVTQDPVSLVCGLSISAANAANLGVDYRATWSWTDSENHQHTRAQFFDVVRSRLVPVIDDDDIAVLIAGVRDRLPRDRNGNLVQESWQPQIDHAFSLIQRRLTAAGLRPCLILDSENLRELHTALSAKCVAEFLQSDGADPQLWADMSDKYEAEYEFLWERLTLRYDVDDDGLIDGDERATKPSHRRRMYRGAP